MISHPASMKGFEVQSATEQVATRLREELLRGTWVGLMQGEDCIAANSPPLESF